jgi:hypothetical protein
MSSDALDRLYRDCDALLNICGATELRDVHLEAECRVFLETDPVGAQLRMANGDEHIRAIHSAHTAFATYGENFGTAACAVPLNDIEYVKTRQPIDLEAWPFEYDVDARNFTTIGNYRQRRKDIEYQGEMYHWSKHHEWERFVELPSLTDQPFELALELSDRDRSYLERHGWRVIPTLPMTLDIFGAYPEFIRRSRAEFTVAKDQNIRFHSGWFSERDACYLASGKPVVAQDTGFGEVLPTGEGLFSFTTIDEALGAIDDINRDYARHCKAARAIAEEFLDAPAVAGRLVEDLGLV